MWRLSYGIREVAMQVTAFSKRAMLFFVLLMAFLVIETAIVFKPVTPVVIKNSLGSGRVLKLDQTQPSQQVISVQPGQQFEVARIARPLPLSGKKGAPYTWRGVLTLPNDRRINVAVVYEKGFLYYAMGEGSEVTMKVSDGPSTQKKEFGAYVVSFSSNPDPLNMFYQKLTFEVSSLGGPGIYW